MEINKNLRVLNSKEIKQIMKFLKDQFDYDEKMDYVFMQNNKEKVFIINREIDGIELSKLRIDSAGLYFGKFFNDGFRLSIEGSQLIGNKCKKNVINISTSQKHDWMKGNDIQTTGEQNKFAILKSENDYLGCAKIKEGIILNSVPKARRLYVVNEKNLED